MRVRRYWAFVEVERTIDGRDARSRVWGGSDESAADARRQAEARAADVDWDAISECGPASNPNGYSYLRGVTPEHIVDEFRDDAGERCGAITVNRYGAQVLNTASLAFVDIDADLMNPATCERTNELARTTARVALPRSGDPPRGFLGRLLGKARAWAADDVEVPVPHDRIEAWVAEGPGRGVRAYRTAAGLRLLLTRPPMDPASDESGAVLARFGADPAYAALCRAQESYRARLTPKPWRMKEMDYVRGSGRSFFSGKHPRVGYADYADPGEYLSEWVERYGDASMGYAVCELAAEFGDTTAPDELTGRLIAVHDECTGVGSGLPLA